MKTLRPIAFSLLVAFTPVALSLGGSPALAQQANDSATAAARARFLEGIEFYKKGQFEAARTSFLQAYALKRHPDVLFNLAQSSLYSNHVLEAEKYFTQYLKEAQDIKAERKAEAEKGREEARAKLGKIEIVAASGTEVTLDGERIGTAPMDPLYVDPGAHTVKFKGDGKEETQSVSVLAGQSRKATFGSPQSAGTTPVPVPTPTSPTPPAPTANTPATSTPPAGDGASGNGKGDASAQSNVSVDTDKKPAKNWLAPPENMTPVYIGAGVAVVAFGVSVAMLVAKGSAQSNADTVADQIRKNGGRSGICSSTAKADVDKFGKACAALNDDNNAVNTDATIGNVTLGVGVVALVGTGLYYVLAPKKGDTPAATTTGVHVTPVVGTRYSGLSLSGAF